MGKAKRNPAIVISSSDEDEDKDANLLSQRKRAKRVSLTTSFSTGFDEVKRICEEFDQGFNQFKVTSGFGSNIDLWVEKYKPSCLEALAVHKKKVEEVKTWFEERPKDNTGSNVILISGQAGVGKSATIYAIAQHLGVEVHEWNTPTPTIWKEHLHNSSSGIQYMSKLDEFESFVERIRKYGLVSSSLTRVSPSSIILLIDDLPVVKGKASYGRLQRSLHLLLQSVSLPTVILINDCARSESAEHNSLHLEEVQLALQNAGACKVTFNPITVNSIKRVLSKICKLERIEASNEQMDVIARCSGGDIRHAITSLQYVSLKPHPRHSLCVPKKVSAYPEEKGNWCGHLDDEVSLPFGKDATLSLFHALGKFLHNKRESGSLVTSDGDTIRLKEKFVRCPLKMDVPEMVLCQAHGQARRIADFLHENVLDFVSEEAIEDAGVIGRYLSDTDLLLAASSGNSNLKFEAENLIQSSAASVAVRGVLFGNSYPVSSRWHAIRRPMLWQIEQSLWHNKCRMRSQRGDSHISIRLNNNSVFATELKPSLYWLGDRVLEDTEGHKIPKVNITEDEYDSMSLDDQDNEIDDDEIEDW